MTGPAPSRRLLVLFEATERGGAEDYVLRLAEGLPSRGWSVAAGFPPNGALAPLRDDLVRVGAETHDLRLDVGTATGKVGVVRAMVADAVRTRRLIRRVRPDAVLVNLPYPEAAPGVLIGCSLARAPTAAVFHLVRPGVEIGTGRQRLYAAARRGQRWFAVSAAAATGAQRVFGFDADVPVIPNGIARPLLPTPGARGRIRSELGIGPDHRLLLTVGRLSPQKGHRVLLDAAGDLVRTHPDVRLAWAGDGEEREALERAVADAGLADRVSLLGRRSDVADLLEAADQVVLPSLYEATPFFSLLESLASGTPVVTTEAGAPERLVPDRHALVVPVSDAPALASAVGRLLDDDDFSAAVGEGGRTLVGLEYTADRMLDRTAALLDDTAGR